MDDAIHAAFASIGLAFDAAAYTAPDATVTSPVRGYLSRDVQVLGEFGQVIDRRDELTLLRQDIQAVKNGLVDVDGERYVLSGKIIEDESRVTWAVASRGVTP